MNINMDITKISGFIWEQRTPIKFATEYHTDTAQCIINNMPTKIWYHLWFHQLILVKQVQMLAYYGEREGHLSELLEVWQILELFAPLAVMLSLVSPRDIWTVFGQFMHWNWVLLHGSMLLSADISVSSIQCTTV